MNSIYFYLDRDGTITYKTEEKTEAEAYSCVKKIKISRVRDKNTGMESIMAEMYDVPDDGSPYAIERFSPAVLQADIVRLREFGFLAIRKEMLRMAQIIEDNYYEIDCSIIEGGGALENDIYYILRHICEYIRDKGIEAKRIGSYEVYSIHVNEFSKLFKGSSFARYRITDIRRTLRDMEYTVCSSGRLDYTIKDSGGPAKIIAICADAPDVIDIMQEIDYEK